MQQEQSNHLRQLIENSPILSPAEKADWLDMLILMNDKQAAELAEILTTPRSSSPTPSGAKNQHIPPLTHISNLPAGIATPPKPAPSAPVLPWNEQFRATMEEKELPAPPTTRAVPVPKSAPSAVSFPSRPAPPRPPVTLSPIEPTTTPESVRTAAPTRRRSAPASVQLETLPDTAKLSVGAIRNMNAADLLIRLQQLSRMEGYFNLLSYLEDSPLYRSYINTGQKVLSGQLSFDTMDRTDTSLLTKEEFEAFADILRKIQLN